MDLVRSLPTAQQAGLHIADNAPYSRNRFSDGWSKKRRLQGATSSLVEIGIHCYNINGIRLDSRNRLIFHVE